MGGIDLRRILLSLVDSCGFYNERGGAMPRFSEKSIEGTVTCAPGPPDVERHSTSTRVSVQIGSRAVPLFPSHPVMGSKHSPWTGLILERHHHGTVAIPEHDHATFCLHLQTSRTAAMDWHSSGKTGHVTSGAGNLIFLVPGTRDSSGANSPPHTPLTGLWCK